MRRALFLAVVLLFLAASLAMAQDPVKVDPNPKHYKVEFENEHVRVLRVHLGPKESSPMHEHPPRVSISLTDAHLKITLADGKTEERTATAGAERYQAAMKHAVENLYDKDFEAIEVELKANSASKPAATTNRSPNPEVRVAARD
jgi:quercetin dioxygenase-like cupin family protein